MSLSPEAAERVLRAQLRDPINRVPSGKPRAGQDNDKALGFATPNGRVLALNRKIKGKTHLWFEPPEPPEINDVTLRTKPAKNADLSGRLAVLNERRGLKAEIETEAALQQFLDWYIGSATSSRMPRKSEDHDGLGGETERKFSGSIASSWEDCISEMRQAIESTVKNSNGQIIERAVKNKELMTTPGELKKHLRSLLDIQGKRCALTGIPFPSRSAHEDKNLLPSADRINSNGHYEVDNIQIVCRFINFWKNKGNNKEFKRLLMLVRKANAL